MAQRFYETHGDHYDFLVILPTFFASLGEGADGLYTAVRNDVSGLGKPLFDNGPDFGSPARLKGYIDLRALMNGVPGSTQWTAIALAHEVAHQWSARVGYKETPGGERREDLLGRDGTHWSFFLDSEGSVLYGSDWEARGAGSFESTASLRRYSELDLYLMGFLSPAEVGPLTLLSPAPGEAHASTEIPPPQGTRISATSRLLGLDAIIRAEGPRLPDSASAQKHFRAAFIVLTAPGQTATPAQVAFAEALRRDFENHFFFLTRGRGLFETDLLEQPPGPVAESPGVQWGVSYLLAQQSAAGDWATTPEASLRETHQALEALRLFLSSVGVPDSLDRARAHLETREPLEVDGLARLSLGLQGTDAATLARLRAWLQPSGSVGLTPGYRATLLDTALLGLALTQSSSTVDPVPAVTGFLLERQNPDGGWPAIPGGPSRFEPTALVLEYLARVPRTPAITSAAHEALAFFRDHRDAQGLFVEAGSRTASTGWALTSLATWRQLTAQEASSAASALLARQRADGSWEGSVVDTALALRALRIALTPNLALTSAGVQLSASRVTAGEAVLATVQLANTGHAEARNFRVQGFDSLGRPLGDGILVESLAGGASTSVQWSFDTNASGGSSQAFIVVDPEGAIDEGQEDDNRVAVPLIITEAPAAPELFVQAGSVTLTPGTLQRLPTQVGVSARVGNLGMTAAPEVEVIVRMGSQVLATSQLSLGAQSSQLASWTVQVSTVQDSGRITVEVDPSDAVQEPDETNNVRSAQLGFAPGVDLRVASLTAPATVEQGRDLTFQYELANGGTSDAVSVGSLEIISGGAPIATVGLPSQALSAGGNVTGQLVWRANVAGALSAVLRTNHPDDLDRSNDTASASFEVQASTLPNLMVAAGGVSISPEPPLETQPATVAVTVRNGGQGEASSFSVDFYLGAPESGGTRFHREPVAALAPGATLELTGALTLPQDASEAIYVLLDSEESVSEFDEEDNRSFLPISPVPIADLVVSGADIQPEPAFPREDTTVPVTVSVMNVGGQRAESVSVELLRVLPGGGEELIGQAVLTAIEPGQRGEPVFTWNTTGLRGPQRLLARVDGAQTVPEQREDNNQAERQVAVQDAALALSEPYFSPNGDGVRDVTEISYRMASEAPVEARIEDAQGRTVRLLTAPSASAASVAWEGRSTEGRVVPDGAYRIHVRTLAPAPEVLLGTLTVVVDTNRTPLDSSEPSSLEVEGLEGVASSRMDDSPAVAMPDESGVVFHGEESPSGQCGLYYQPLGGAPARRLTPDGWECGRFASSSGGMAISPDARWIAFHGNAYCPPNGSFCSTLEILSVAEREVVRVATDEESPRTVILPQIPLVFSQDGARVYFVTLDYSLIEFRIEEIRVDGTQRRILARGSHEPIEMTLSPDGGRLALVERNGSLSFIALPGGERQEILAEGTISEGKEPGGYSSIAVHRSDLRHGWSAGGGQIVYATPDMLEHVYSEEGEQGYLPIDPRLESVDLGTGELRRLFTGPRHSLDFLSSMAAVAAHPISGGTTFRYQPLLSTMPQLWTVSSSGQARMLVPYDVQGLRWSPGGSFLFGLTSAGIREQPRLRAITTRDNLFVRLAATRAPGDVAMTFQGTAADLNFAEWELGVRAYASSEPFTVIARSTTQVVKGPLTEWIPPQPGMYEARLMAKDRAGNVRARTVAFGYGLSPAVANLTRTPDLFSPNGDGVLDTVELHYTATRATLVDFQILDAANQVVVQQSLSHEAAGEFLLSWDGRNAEGQRVPDGEYTLSLDGTRLTVEVDTTPPVAMLTLAESGGQHLPAPYQYSDVLPVDLDPQASTDESARTRSLVRIVVAGTTWKIQDAHLQDWTLEVASPEDPLVSQPLLTGTNPVDAEKAIAVESLRGAFRLRVKDRAGNQSLTSSLRLDDRLFVTLVGDPAQIHLSWLLPGQVMPRVRPFTSVQMNPQGKTVLPRLPGGRYALGLNTTSGARLVSFSVAYRTGAGPWTVDTQNVTALGEAMVLWDARSAGTPSEIELRAVDADGRLLQAPLQFEAESGEGSRTRFSCVKTRGGEFTVLSAFVGDSLTQPADLASGGQWRFTEVDTRTVTSFPVAPYQLASTPAGLRVQQKLSTAHLPGCRYEVDFLGARQNGQPLTDRGTVDLCKPQITVSEDGVVLSESFRQPIRSAEVFVSHSGREVVVARFGAFESTSAVHPLERSRFPASGLYTLRARATLENGMRVVTEPNLSDTSPHLLDEGCNDEREYVIPEGTLSLSAPARDGDAGLCGIHAPTYTAKLTGNGGAGQQLQSLSVEIVTPQGEIVSRPEVSGAPVGASTILTSVSIDPQALPEGTYALRASATWSDGSISRADPQPLFIDRTPAHVVMTRPAALGSVCPESRRSSGGVLEQYLVVEGAVADGHLESYELFLRESGGEPLSQGRATFSPASPTAFQGVLGTVEVTGRDSHFELLLSARDVSGSSWCAAPLAVQVATPPSLSATTLSPAVFSPDGDGRFDTTMILFGLDQAASVTLTAEATGQQPHTLFQGSLPEGEASLNWNGAPEGGTRLPDGAYPLRIRATNSCGQVGEVSTLVELDTQAPVSRIDFPSEGQVLGASFTVTGEATDAHLSQYELSIGEGASPTQYTPIVSGTAAATGVLGAVSLEELPVGEYTLRLVVEDTVGHTQETLRRFLHQPASLLRAALVEPGLISPDGDGVLDTALLHVTLAAPATVSAALVDGAGNPTRVLVEPTSLPASTSLVPLTQEALAGLPTGVYTLRVSADSGGAVDTAPASLEIDVSAPQLVVVSPAAGGVQGAHLSVEGSIDDTSLESWTLAHVAPGTTGPGDMIASGSTATSGILAVLDGLAEGTHQLLLKAQDRAGHAHEHTVSFQVDVTPPQAAFLAPLGGAFLSGRDGPVEVRAHAEDEHLHSVRLEATTASGSQTLFSGASVPPGGLLHTWSVGYEDDGEAELRLVVEDTAGNTTESVIALTLDSTPPVASLVEPRGGVRGEGLTFRGSATDENLSSWELELGRGAPGSVATFQRIAGTAQPVSSDVLTTLASVGDGDYVARLRVRDTAGHEALDEAAFTVDSIAPLPVPALSATVVRPNTVTLAWEPSPSSDVMAYEVLRAAGSGAPVSITTLDSEARAYEDGGLADGLFRYTVVARDAAQNPSLPSPEARVEIDATPPIAIWLFPAPAEEVHGVLELQGSAFSQQDFREYRISIGSGQAPSDFELVHRSPLPVSAGLLGELDVRSLPQGSVHTLRLEAEDLSGNVSEARVTFVVDNLPPAAPVLQSAVASGTSVSLSWQSSASEDLLGFVVFRDAMPLGVPEDVSPRDLRPYALASTSRSYTDTSVPDGVHTYHLVAIDRAGNLSAPSNSRQATVETGAPMARITEPTTLERLRGDTWLRASGEDLDIASVRFEARGAPTDPFTAVGALAIRAPYTTRMTLAPFSGRVLELRAVATDTLNKVDPAPSSIHVLKETVPAQPSITAQVDGSQVQLSWTGTYPDGLLAGFELSEDGAPVTAAPERWPGTAFATSTAYGSPEEAYDDDPYSTAWVAESALPQAWTLELDEPVLLRGISLAIGDEMRLRLEGRIDGFWVQLGSEVLAESYSFVTHALEQPVEVDSVRVVILDVSYGEPTLYDVRLDALPLEHETITLLSSVSLGQHAYSVRAMGFGGTASEASTVSIRVYAPVLEASASATPESSISLQGREVPPLAQVELLSEGAAIDTTTADANGLFTFTAPLEIGANTFQARATDGAGNRSLPSEPVTVVSAPAPTAVLTLSLDAVEGSDVSLSFSVEGASTEVVGYVLERESEAGLVELPISSPDARGFTDQGVRNGAHSYRLHALNGSGFRGPASNAVTVTVDVEPPAAPVEVAVEPLTSGGALAVSWAPGDALTVAYRVERAIGAEGPFEVLMGFEHVLTTRIVDRPLSDDTLYRYRIIALDALGNASSPSAVASGVPVDMTPPAPPHLTRPTVAGKPITVTSPTTTLAGLTEPGTLVTLLRNGVYAGQAPAGALGVESFPLELSLTPQGTGWASADGRHLAYIVPGNPSWTQALAVESRSGGLIGTFSAPSSFGIQEAIFSPDGRRVALQVLSSVTFQSMQYVVDLETGSLQRPAELAHGAEVSATWAPNAREVAYEVTRSGIPAVVVVDTTVGHPQWLTGPEEAPLMAPRYAPEGSLLFALTSSGASMQLLRMDPASGVSTSLFEADSIERSYAISADSQRIALVATRDGQADLYVVSVATGASVRLTQDPEHERLPAFSQDGRRLAFVKGSQLVLHEDGREQRYEGFTGTWLSWDHEGALLASAPLGISRLVWGARFEFTGVRLEQGGNMLSATATDAAQRTSLSAAPLEITLDATTLPDLVAEVRLHPEVPRMGQPFDAFVTVRNQGGGSAPSTSMAVAVLSPDGGSITPQPLTLPALAAGGMTTAVVPLSHPELHGPQILEVLVDPEEQVDDPARDNNRVRHPFSLALDDQPVVAVSVSPNVVQANEESLATITVANPGAARTVEVDVWLVTQSGEPVFQVGAVEHLSPLEAGRSITFTRPVNVGQTLAGSYQVKATVREGSTVLSEMGAPLTLVADRTTHLRLAASRSSYRPGEPIVLTGTVLNASTNSFLEGASYSLTVTGPEGSSVLEVTTALPRMALGASHSVPTELPSLGLPPGQYEVRGTVALSSQPLATATARFTLEGRPLVTGAISVLGEGAPPAISSGQPLRIDFVAGNQGTAVEPSLALRVAIIDPSTEVAVASHALPAQPLEVGASVSGQHDFSTAGLALKSYAAYLLAERPDGTIEALASAHFRIVDGQGPILHPLNLTDGMFVAGSVHPWIQATDADSGVAYILAEVLHDPWGMTMYRAEGTPFDGNWTSQLAFFGEGPHTLVFTAADHAGNVTQLTLTVINDVTPPEIAITGVTEGALYATPAVPVVEVSDTHLAATTALLDGAPFTSGTAVSSDGAHALLVQAVDHAGNHSLQIVHFTVDTTAPWVSVRGVTEGGVYREDVVPVVIFQDRDLVESSVTLDGQPFVPGTVVTAEGAHVLFAQARDRAGNLAEREVRFAIDRTAPSIDITGVSEGGQYQGAVTPVITVEDTHLATREVRLNGALFLSGTTLAADGNYTLTVHAQDLAGHVTERTLPFSVQTEVVELTQVDTASFARVLALIRTGSCAASASEVQRVQGFLEAELGGPERLLSVALTEGAFLEGVRSGVANVFLLIHLDSSGAECSESADAPQTLLRPLWAREVTEQVFSGHAGLVVLRARTERLSELREVLGVDFLERTRQGMARLPASALEGPAYLNTPAGGVRLQALEASVQPAALYSESGEALAAALHTFGEGRSVTFGFDLTSALPGAHAALALRQAVAHVTPPASQPTPLGILGVELRLTNASRASQVRVVETLPAPLTVAWASSEGAIAPGGHAVTWEPVLAKGQARGVRLLVRLPEASGSHPASATLESLRGAQPLHLGTRRRELVQPLSPEQLLSRVRTAAARLEALEESGVLEEIETRLQSVEARSVTKREDVEAQLEELFAAVDASRGLSGDPKPVRKALGELIRYWQARWYLL